MGVAQAELILVLGATFAAGVWLGRRLERAPGLLIRAVNDLQRLWWRWRSRRRGGRPRLNRELIALIRRMSLENPLQITMISDRLDPNS